MNKLWSGCRRTVVAAVAAVLVACGGSTVSSGGADSGPQSADTDGGDARGHRDGARATDGSTATDGTTTADAAGGVDASDATRRPDTGHHPLDAGSLCFTPAFDGGITVAACGDAHCPTGTVCIQIDEDVTSEAKCVSIPAACGGKPTCACMAAEALACGRPGTRFIDAGIGPGTCQDEGEGAGTYLDLPCGCA
jgi:hypothetical protein